MPEYVIPQNNSDLMQILTQGKRYFSSFSFIFFFLNLTIPEDIVCDWSKLFAFLYQETKNDKR